jgi:hypothetical protein
LNGCEAIGLQIEQGKIQTKGVFPLYQLQVVFNDDDDIRVAPTPQKWVAQSSMDLILISQNH